MRLVELSLELARQQLFRQSAHGRVPRIMSIVFHPLDDDGKIFHCHVTFSFGVDYIAEFEFDHPVDLSDDAWEERIDAAVFDDRGCRWPQ